MPLRYWFVIITYVVTQLSYIVGVPLTSVLYGYGFDITALSAEQLTQAAVTWSVFSFAMGLIITLLLLRPDMKNTSLTTKDVPASSLILWSILGIFIAFAGQYAAAIIEIMLGIPQVSENTQGLMNIAKAAPIFIIIITVFAPILEEILFRKILFGSIYKKTNFFIAAIISSLIFSIIHMDFTHTIKYTAMGFVFAFLYVKTKRIIVPIIAHMSMNLIVVIAQYSVDPEQIKEMEQQLENLQTIILGG
ncbi:CPBP family intramembrane glutamic endopeptidase [Pontibacillus litoralis]|uniref:Peptidase n=1 Tax=Pontibacillus litoralis JSM 072002 TaxID=1385512 RepID=A0A0A5FWC4_9BACI|nr:type II CAAX endopeptidase family protein [Pontibacillus litoralis]KGX85066.1 peptidase [Pontibacillus litoralis JSM 072002]